MVGQRRTTMEVSRAQDRRRPQGMNPDSGLFDQFFGPRAAIDRPLRCLDGASPQRFDAQAMETAEMLAAEIDNL
jgi:hypothetical protein